MVIFTRTFDYLNWILPVTNHFPKAHRHSVTRRLLDASFDMYEWLVQAHQVRGAKRKEALDQASVHLDKVRLYLRLAEQWKWLSKRQYQHAAKMVAEIGKLLGGWQRATGNT